VQRPGAPGGPRQRPVELELQDVRQEIAHVRHVGRHVILRARIEVRSLRASGASTPWYLRRNSHQVALYCSGVIWPEKTFHRHWSISSPERQERHFFERRASSSPMSFEASVGLSRTQLHQVLGRVESAMGPDGLVEAVVGAVAGTEPAAGRRRAG